MIIIRCHSCGFILAKITSRDVMTPETLNVILRKYGYRCPVCLSPLNKTPIRSIVGNKELTFPTTLKS